MSPFRITNENTADRLASTDKLQDAIRLAREVAQNEPGVELVCMEHNGMNIMQLVRLPKGKVSEVTLA